MAEAVFLTPDQNRLILEHTAADSKLPPEPGILTPSQHLQMERDLKLLLPSGYLENPSMGLRSSKQGGAEELAEYVVPYLPKLGIGLPGASRKWRSFPMGGLVYHDKPAWMQRVDQGQDFEIKWGTHIIAPGWGKCLAWLHDGPFPSGFGSPYGVYYFGNGRLGGRIWYAGHVNYVLVRPGETFHAGRPLGRAYNSLTPGRGWIEFGHAANGYPMSMGEGAKWNYLFRKPEWRYSS